MMLRKGWKRCEEVDGYPARTHWVREDGAFVWERRERSFGDRVKVFLWVAFLPGGQRVCGPDGRPRRWSGPDRAMRGADLAVKFQPAKTV
jgi:hypothetical protein